MKIHFPLFQSFFNYSKLLNIAQVRSYIKLKNLNINPSYQFLESSKIHINLLEPGKRISDLPDLNWMVRLINNYYEGKDLLDNIPVPEDTHKKVIEQVNKYYDKELDYDCICYSTFIPFMLPILYSIFLIKRKNPNIDIMVGGMQMEVSNASVQIFKTLDVVDYVLTGDIELAIEKYANGDLKKSDFFIGYSNMKELTTPLFYSPEIKMEHNLLINTSRSCPFRCSFCSGTIGPLRSMDPSTIIETVKYYNKYRLKHFQTTIYFTDNTFNFSKKRMHEICDGLIAINNKIPLEAYFVYDNLDRDIIRKLGKANFNIIRVGLDAFAKEKRFFAKKKFDLTEDYINDIAEGINEAGMTNQIFIIFGMPNESEESFNTDFELSLRLREKPGVKVFPFFFGLSVGSDIYLNPKEYNIHFENWETEPCVISKITEIVHNTPRYYFADASQMQYVNQFKRLRPLLSDDDGYKSTTLELEKMMKKGLL